MSQPIMEIVNAVVAQGERLLEVHDYPRALTCFIESARLCRQVSEDAYVRQMTIVASLHFELNQIEECLDVYRTLYDGFAAEQNLAAQARVLNNMGLIYRRSGQHDAALAHYQRARELFEILDDVYHIAEQFENIGTVYRDKQDYLHGLKNYHDALKLFSLLNHRGKLADLHSNVAHITAIQGDTDAALQWYLAALDLYDDVNDGERRQHIVKHVEELRAVAG
nr:tetratricopeptide repeat protein [uncultured Desulfuromonas sp.]